MFEFLDEKRNKKNAEEIRKAGIMNRFHYDFGRPDGSQESYTLTRKGDCVNVVIQKIGSTQPDIRRTADISVFSTLYRILMEQKIYFWNGFHKSNSMAINGYSFSLEVQFENWTLSASGCAMKPTGYDAAHRVLEDYLHEIK